MKKVLALDASTKRTGYAYWDENNNIKYGAISSAAVAPEKRIGIMRDEILKIVKENNINTIIMEEVRPDGMNQHTGKILTWLQGCIVVAIYEYNKNIEIDFIEPSSWRSKLGLQGYRVLRPEQKKRDIEYANKTYNLNLTSVQDDEADALCILKSYNITTSNIKHKQTQIGEGESAF